MSEEDFTTRELIEGIRGGAPTKCDFCDKETPSEHLEPEEAGAWVCHRCLRRWEMTEALQSYKRKLIEALEKWQHKDSSLNGYYEILDFIKQWEPGEK